MGISTLISTSTASNASSIAITSGIDSTYDEYMFVMTDVNPASANVHFRFNGSTDSGSNYDVTKTTTAFRATHQTGTEYFGYHVQTDLAQSTGYQILGRELGSDSSESFCGVLHIFSPSSTTYVKHFYSRMSSNWSSAGEQDYFIAGYINTTAAITAIDFKMTATGNMDDGTIKMYGVG